MTPTIKEAKGLLLKTANDNGINLEKVDINWINHIIGGTQICDFSDDNVLNIYMVTALKNIPKKAKLN